MALALCGVQLPLSVPVMPRAGWGQQRVREGAAGQHCHTPAQEQGAKSWGLLEIWLGLTPWAPRGAGEGWGLSGPLRVLLPTQGSSSQHLLPWALLPWLWALPGDSTVTVTHRCCPRGSGTGTPLGEQGVVHRVSPGWFLGCQKTNLAPLLPCQLLAPPEAAAP